MATTYSTGRSHFLSAHLQLPDWPLSACTPIWVYCCWTWLGRHHLKTTIIHEKTDIISGLQVIIPLKILAKLICLYNLNAERCSTSPSQTVSGAAAAVTAILVTSGRPLCLATLWWRATQNILWDHVVTTGIQYNEEENQAPVKKRWAAKYQKSS